MFLEVSCHQKLSQRINCPNISVSWVNLDKVRVREDLNCIFFLITIKNNKFYITVLFCSTNVRPEKFMIENALA